MDKIMQETRAKQQELIDNSKDRFSNLLRNSNNRFEKVVQEFKAKQQDLVGELEREAGKHTPLDVVYKFVGTIVPILGLLASINTIWPIPNAFVTVLFHPEGASPDGLYIKLQNAGFAPMHIIKAELMLKDKPLNDVDFKKLVENVLPGKLDLRIVHRNRIQKDMQYWFARNDKDMTLYIISFRESDKQKLVGCKSKIGVSQYFYKLAYDDGYTESILNHLRTKEVTLRATYSPMGPPSKSLCPIVAQVYECLRRWLTWKEDIKFCG